MLSPIDEIKNKLDIVDVVSAYIKLQKAGRNWRARCPFHAEKTPSFFVSPERQIWHCFGCGKGGDIFGFVKEIEGVEFTDALRTLAQKAGVVLKRQDPKLRSEKQRLYEICELAVKFFIKQLEASKTGEKIKKYLRERGIKNETIAAWRLGYAPDDWYALSNFLKSRGYTDDEIIKSGLVVEYGTKSEIRNGTSSSQTRTKSDIRYYDRFRNRTIFPLFDINSQVVGFAGRVVPWQKDESAKYINTPQTLIYDKSRLLYGLDRAKIEIRKNDACIVVEGYTDVIMSHQAGIKNTIATSGTALTEDQLKIIKRYTENLILAFDMDIAGDTATKRAIDLAIRQGFDVKIVQQDTADKKNKLTQSEVGGDPADIIQKNPKKWQEKIDNTQGIVEYYFQNALSQYNRHEAKGKKEIAKTILPLLKKIPNKIEQAHWLQELARVLHIQEKYLVEALRDLKDKSSTTPTISSKEPPKAESKPRHIALEEEFVGLIYSTCQIPENIPSVKLIFTKEKADSYVTDQLLKKIIKSFKNYLSQHKGSDKLNLKQWQSNLTPEQALTVNQSLFQIEIKQIDKNRLGDYLRHCINELKKYWLRQKLNHLQLEIKTSESAKDKNKLKNLLTEFKKVAHELSTCR